jgi:hypothetical protein
VEGSCRGTIRAFAGRTRENDEKPQSVSRAVGDYKPEASPHQPTSWTNRDSSIATERKIRNSVSFISRTYSLQLGHDKRYFKYTFVHPNNTVAYTPVAGRCLCGQRPFLGNGSVNMFAWKGMRTQQ